MQKSIIRKTSNIIQDVNMWGTISKIAKVTICHANLNMQYNFEKKN